MPYALSIDVGTTFTSAATWADGRATTVTLGDHAEAIPSVLFLRSEDDVLLVGDAAVRRATADPTRVAREFKRRIGDNVPLSLGSHPFSPELLTAHVIRWVVDLTTARDGGPPAHVTLTYPASWGSHRRSKMTQAASAAGLGAVGLLTEPEAAATYYASRHRLEPGTTVAVYDFGGGTFDAAVLRKTRDGFIVLGQPDGVDDLGGLDLDAALMAHVAEVADIDWSAFDVADPDVLVALAQLRARVVDAKEALSADFTADLPVVLPGLHRRVRLSRRDFEGAIEPHIRRTLDALQRTMDGADTGPAGVTAVLLVGGSSRIPMIARLVTEELGLPALVDAHPKHAVCLGAAIGAAARVAPSSSVDPAPSSLTTARDPAAQVTRDRPAPAPGRAHPQPETPIAATPSLPRLGAQSTSTSTTVDRVAAGLTAPADRETTLAPAERAALRVTSRDEPLVIRLDDGTDDNSAYWRLLGFVAVAIALVVAVALISRLR